MRPLTCADSTSVREALIRRSGGIIAVDDPVGELADVSVAGFDDVHAGLVSLLIRPGLRRVVNVAADFQTALGADQDLTGFGRPGDGEWDLATVAALAHEVGHILIFDPWLLTTTHLSELIENIQATGAVIWLVGRGAFSDEHREVVARWTPSTITGEEFRAAWQDRLHRAPLPAPDIDRCDADAPDVFPVHVPDVDFTLFRAACRDTLDKDAFAAADAHFIEQASAGSAWMQANLTGVTLDDEKNLAGHLHGQWNKSATIAHFIVTIRAYQVAAFSIGWQLQVDIPQLVGTARVSPSRATRPPALWRRLLRYSNPERGAVCALTAAGVDIADQVTLPIEAVTRRGHLLVMPDGQRVKVEDGATHYLHAQKLARLLTGANGDAPLLGNEHDKPMPERTAARILTTARLELGLNLVGTRAERRQPTGTRWFNRWGLSIQELR